MSKHTPGYTQLLGSLDLGNLMFFDIYLKVEQSESWLPLIEVNDNALYG